MNLSRRRQLGPALHLDRRVGAIREAVDDPIHAHVAQRQEHMQTAHRLPHQLRPHLELGHLPRGQGLAVTPPRIGLQRAALCNTHARN